MSEIIISTIDFIPYRKILEIARGSIVRARNIGRQIFNLLIG